METSMIPRFLTGTDDHIKHHILEKMLPSEIKSTLTHFADDKFTKVWFGMAPSKAKFFTTFYLGLCEGDLHLQPANVDDLKAAGRDSVYDFHSSKGKNMSVRIWKQMKQLV